MNGLHNEGLVLKFHQSLQNKALDTSCNDLNPTTPSCGKHNVSHDAQCLALSPTELLQKKANNLYSLLVTEAGGFTIDN